MAKNFKLLQEKLPPEIHARAQATAEVALQEMVLGELREARHMTQVEIAKKLKKKQPAVSKIENGTDMYISTLRRAVAAMGGMLDIRAVFPETTVRISQFKALK